MRVVTVGNGWPADLVGFDHQQSTPDAQALEDVVAGLPSRDDRRISCPNDFGRRIHVDLSSGNTVVTAFDVSVTGCRYVYRDGRIFESSDDFWQVLARVSGLTVQQLR